ncbi:eCIS core domain-containing protein [Streptomyces eurythermus]|uniref:eCIS core domain-containing protein n=1 Tax=Streptomyces eurythermus TaxID=42237 RepID=UPI003F4D6B3C
MRSEAQAGPAREHKGREPDRPPRTASRPPLPGLLTLQSSVGNAAVVQMLLQAGHPGVQEEHRHDADRDHRRTGHPVQRSTVHDVLRTPGRPLDDDTREDMETRLGTDFSDVRIHTDAAARASAAEVGARAYTSGSHVVIGDGGADKHTLAHELTHVIQQRRGRVAGTDNGAGLKVSDPSDRFEREAEATASRALRGPAPGGQRPSGSGASTVATTQPFSVQRVKYDSADDALGTEQPAHASGEQFTTAGTPGENQAQAPGQARSNSGAGNLRTYAPKDFRFVTELKGGSSSPWHVRVNGVDKVFKFSQPRGRTPRTPAGVPGPITVPEPGDAAESSAAGAKQAKKSNSLPAEEIMLAEMLTGKIYQAAGAKVLPAEFAWVATGDEAAAEWTLAQVTDFRTVDEDRPDAAKIASMADFLPFVGLDVVLAIFDLRKPPNWMKIGADLYRQDLGGAMYVSAQGAPKKPGDFMESTDVTQTIDSMSTGPHSSGSPYAGVPPERFAESLVDLDKRLPPATIERLVNASGLPEAKRSGLIAALNGRISSGVQWARGYAEPVAMFGRQVSHGLEPDPEPATESDWPNTLAYDALEYRDIHRLVGEQRARIESVVTGLGKKLSDAAEGSHLATTLQQLKDLIDAKRQPMGSDRELARTARRLHGQIMGWPMEVAPEPLRTLARVLPGFAGLVSAEEKALARMTDFERSQQRSDDPYAAPPSVGPEELLNPDQYTAEMARKLHDDLQRLRGRHLVRRVSRAEEANYRIAAKEQDVGKAVEALFDTKGHERGEIVFSVEDAFILSRESAWAKAVEIEVERRFAGEPPVREVPDLGPGYARVVEIPITPELLGFLENYAYFSTPVTAKPNAFMPNPNVKYEGAAGGTGDAGGIPNVVVKKQGFGQFLAATRAITFIDAATSATMKRLWEKEVTKGVDRLREHARLRAKNAEKAPAKANNGLELDDDDFFAGLPF